jgi:hypothetical protein
MTRRTRQGTSAKVGGVRQGRPETSPETARRNRVVALVTDAEFAELTRIAKRHGTSMSAACRQILVRHLTKNPKSKVDKEGR